MKQHQAAAVVQCRYECQGKQDDTQSAYPLRDGPLEQNPPAATLHVTDDSGTRGREARHGLKEALAHIERSRAKKIGQHAKK